MLQYWKTAEDPLTGPRQALLGGVLGVGIGDDNSPVSASLEGFADRACADFCAKVFRLNRNLYKLRTDRHRDVRFEVP